MKTFTLGQSRKQVEEMLPEAQIKTVQLGAKKVCMVKSGQEIFAFEPQCPHRMAALNEGKINGFNEIICPLHEYRFDLETGQVKSGDCRDLEVYKTELTEQGLKIFI
ncbi:MAG: Rieske (2Fe-2S) protein [Mongoliibacter sp.]|uniref:Rieske (2Fe-2S) protein n=1 Tax=Mongoliibacter sp. TaxID=2022438 RepID=UPI0012F39C34|nr:Rieske 2Fe-2S domain-containing protein [Mongoliibacter sp.]TVP47502.1 MAG: Rieske (2Fe-2S) protein [Mongoliibacter sp.]